MADFNYLAKLSKAQREFLYAEVHEKLLLPCTEQGAFFRCAASLPCWLAFIDEWLRLQESLCGRTFADPKSRGTMLGKSAKNDFDLRVALGVCAWNGHGDFCEPQNMDALLGSRIARLKRDSAEPPPLYKKVAEENKKLGGAELQQAQAYWASLAKKTQSVDKNVGPESNDGPSNESLGSNSGPIIFDCTGAPSTGLSRDGRDVNEGGSCGSSCTGCCRCTISNSAAGGASNSTSRLMRQLRESKNPSVLRLASVGAGSNSATTSSADPAKTLSVEVGSNPVCAVVAEAPGPPVFQLSFHGAGRGSQESSVCGCDDAGNTEDPGDDLQDEYGLADGEEGEESDSAEHGGDAGTDETNAGAAILNLGSDTLVYN